MSIKVLCPQCNHDGEYCMRCDGTGMVYLNDAELGLVSDEDLEAASDLYERIISGKIWIKR